MAAAAFGKCAYRTFGSSSHNRVLSPPLRGSTKFFFLEGETEREENPTSFSLLVWIHSWAIDTGLQAGNLTVTGPFARSGQVGPASPIVSLSFFFGGLSDCVSISLLGKPPLRCFESEKDGGVEGRALVGVYNSRG